MSRETGISSLFQPLVWINGEESGHLTIEVDWSDCYSYSFDHARNCDLDGPPVSVIHADLLDLIIGPGPEGRGSQADQLRRLADYIDQHPR
jgi:hypothetical protein